MEIYSSERSVYSVVHKFVRERLKLSESYLLMKIIQFPCVQSVQLIHNSHSRAHTVITVLCAATVCEA